MHLPEDMALWLNSALLCLLCLGSVTLGSGCETLALSPPLLLLVLGSPSFREQTAIATL